MGLFSNPVTLSDDGGTTTDRTFEFRAQLIDSKTTGGDYIETAADAAAKSLFVVKHDMRSTAPRHLLQRSVRKHPVAETDNDDLLPITINLTIVANEAFSEAEIQEEVNLLLDAAEESNFVKGMQTGLI